MEKLSTIERLHQSERERGRIVVHDTSLERKRKWAADEEARRFEAVARALPDDLFSGHHEVAAAMAMVKAMRQRADGLSRGFMSLRGSVSSLIRSLEVEIREAEAGLTIAAIDDALTGDLEFTGARVVLGRLDEARKRIRAAQLVAAEVGKSPPDFREFNKQAEAAEAALRSLLVRLKREHVQANPELLEGN